MKIEKKDVPEQYLFYSCFWVCSLTCLKIILIFKSLLWFGKCPIWFETCPLWREKCPLWLEKCPLWFKACQCDLKCQFQVTSLTFHSSWMRSTTRNRILCSSNNSFDMDGNVHAIPNFLILSAIFVFSALIRRYVFETWNFLTFWRKMFPW